MKTHTTTGADILSGHGSALLEMARCIAMTHHEKWNGTGYPQRLAAGAIPMPGRIVTVAEVFDALTSVRPYKSARSVKDATAFIEDNSGKHFGPELVEVFGQHRDATIGITQHNADSDETCKC